MATILTTTYDSITESNTVTITLASLATDSARLTGRASTVVDNTSNKFVDVQVFGQVTTGTSPTLNRNIEVWVYTPIQIAASTFNYPIATATELTASDAAATFEVYQKQGLELGAVMTVNATSARAYNFRFHMLDLFRSMPTKWGVFVAHDTGVNLSSTASLSWIEYTGITYTNT